MHYFHQEKGTGALLFSGEGNRCSTAFRREQLYYCFKDKETDALLFQEKGSGTLLFSGERNW